MSGSEALLSCMLLQGIDYASIHLWPDNWGRSDIDFARYWILNHTGNALSLGKPIPLDLIQALAISIA